MSEAQTTEWRKMLRNVCKEQIQDDTTIVDDNIKHVDVQFTLIHDDRRANWQRIPYDATDEDVVLCSVGRFLFEQMEDEIRASADRAVVSAMSKPVSKVMKRIERKHKLTETERYDYEIGASLAVKSLSGHVVLEVDDSVVTLPFAFPRNETIDLVAPRLDEMLDNITQLLRVAVELFAAIPH